MWRSDSGDGFNAHQLTKMGFGIIYVPSNKPCRRFWRLFYFGEHKMSSLLQTYNRIPVAFDRGEGVRLFSTDGEAYLDFGAGIAVSSLGHAHPHLVEALKPRRKSCGIPQIFTKFLMEKSWHKGCVITPLPMLCFLPTLALRRLKPV